VLANQLADLLPKPWERYLPAYKDNHNKADLEKTPSQTQRSFANILDVILDHLRHPLCPEEIQ
jgi:hypothetical protein